VRDLSFLLGTSERSRCSGTVTGYDHTGGIETMENYLKAVFWDYPNLNTPENIKRVLQDARDKDQRERLYWIMSRFLERGRVKSKLLSLWHYISGNFPNRP
jgi:hypothetical protein